MKILKKFSPRHDADADGSIKRFRKDTVLIPRISNYSMIPMKPVVHVAAFSPAVSFLAQRACFTIASGSSASALMPPTAGAALTSLAPAFIPRGGAVETAFDPTRARIRLEGLHSYVVVSTLMLNASLRLFSSTPKPLVKGEKTKNTAKILFTAAIVASVLSGLYTTISFSLLGMYVKTAIGMNKNPTAFFDATQNIREHAFGAFIVSLSSFNASFILSLFLNYEGRMKWWVAGIAAALSLLSWMQWSTIMSIATQLIFT